MQPSEDNLDHWGALFRMHTNRNTPTVIINGDATVAFQRNGDGLAKSSQRLVGGVIEYLLDDMQGILCTGVHPRPLANRLEALENPDRPLRVFCFACSHSLVQMAICVPISTTRLGGRRK